MQNPSVRPFPPFIISFLQRSKKQEQQDLLLDARRSRSTPSPPPISFHAPASVLLGLGWVVVRCRKKDSQMAEGTAESIEIPK